MPSARHWIAAVSLVSVTGTDGRAATLQYVSAFRELRIGTVLVHPAAEYARFDESIAGIVDEPGRKPRQSASASQYSDLGAVTITVGSRITGDSEQGASFCVIHFDLDEVATFSLSGSYSLLGSDGFVCVNLANLAQTAAPYVHEFDYAPPFVSTAKPLLFSGTLPAGSYILEAMIYGGGDGQLTLGDLNVVFSIPESGRTMMAVAGLGLLLRRTRPPLKIAPAAG